MKPISRWHCCKGLRPALSFLVSLPTCSATFLFIDFLPIACLATAVYLRCLVPRSTLCSPASSFLTSFLDILNQPLAWYYGSIVAFPPLRACILRCQDLSTLQLEQLQFASDVIAAFTCIFHAYLPHGLLCYKASVRAWCRCAQGVWSHELAYSQLPLPSLFLSEDCHGLWSFGILNDPDLCPPWPRCDELSAAHVLVWEPLVTGTWQLPCFFQSLGFTLATFCNLPGLRPFLLQRQTSGHDLATIAGVLQPLLPDGFLVVHSHGCCFHFHPKHNIGSYLPSDLFAFASHCMRLPVLYYDADRAHFCPCGLLFQDRLCFAADTPAAASSAHVLRLRFLRFPFACIGAVLDTISGGMPRAPLFTEEAILAAFEEAERVVFPLQDLRILMPEVMQHCCLVADTLSVPLSWVLLAEICTAAFLAPTSVLYAAKTLPLYTMPWALILHPGATQTSGLMSAYSKVLRQIEIWEHDRQVALAQREQQQAREGLEAEESERKRQRFVPPPPMHMGFTSGSVDGVVGRMAEPQNLSRAAAFLAEAQVFLTWISEQNATNQGLMAQLTDRLVWDKVTVKDRTTVVVDAPFIGICGAVHMEELMQTIGQADPLGLRPAHV